MKTLHPYTLVAASLLAFLLSVSASYAQDTDARTDQSQDSAAIARILEIVRENSRLKAALELQEVKHQARLETLTRQVEDLQQELAESRGNGKAIRPTSSGDNPPNRMGKEISALVLDAQSKLQSGYQRLNQKLLELQEEAPHVIWTQDGVHDPYAENYSLIQNELAATRIEIEKLRAILEYVDAAIAAGRSSDSIMRMIESAIARHSRWAASWRKNEASLLPEERLGLAKTSIRETVGALKKQEASLKELADNSREKSSDLQKHLGKQRLLKSEIAAIRQLSEAYKAKVDELGLSPK